MKTEDVLNLDCTKEENVKQINRFLWKVKPVEKILERNNYTKTEKAPIVLLEQALHGIMIRYGYRTQNIDTYIEKDNFVFYMCSVIKKRDSSEWIGNVYGKTLWEVVAKTIIKIYADIKKEKKG